MIGELIGATEFIKIISTGGGVSILAYFTWYFIVKLKKLEQDKDDLNREMKAEAKRTNDRALEDTKEYLTLVRDFKNTQDKMMELMKAYSEKAVEDIKRAVIDYDMAVKTKLVQLEELLRNLNQKNEK